MTSKKQITFASILSILTLASCVSLPAGDTWTSLFDGKTLAGWVQKNGTATYEVKDGAILGTTAKKSPNSFLCSDKDYGDFELEFEVFLYNNELNSGVQIRSQTKETKDGKVGRAVERKVRELGPVGMKDIPGRPHEEWVKQYHEGVLAIDESVGKLVDTLKLSGQLDNTLIVFTSDQGFAWGQKGFKSKVAPYRATVAAPFIIVPPKNNNSKIAAGRVIEEPVSGADIPPTFFSYAGIDLPWKMHGRSLHSLLGSKDKKWKHPTLLVHTAKQYGSDTDVVPQKEDPRLLHGPGIPWYVMLSEGKYKYIRTLIAGETEELYDIEKDPEELLNLAQDKANSAILKQYRKAALKELKRTNAKMVDNLPPVGTEKFWKETGPREKSAWIA